MLAKTLATLLAARGLDPAACRAIRVSLNPADRNEDFATTADLARTGAIDMYVRMQDGQTFGPACDVLVFAAEPQLPRHAPGTTVVVDE